MLFEAVQDTKHNILGIALWDEIKNKFLKHKTAVDMQNRYKNYLKFLNKDDFDYIIDYLKNNGIVGFLNFEEKKDGTKNFKNIVEEDPLKNVDFENTKMFLNEKIGKNKTFKERSNLKQKIRKKLKLKKQEKKDKNNDDEEEKITKKSKKIKKKNIKRNESFSLPKDKKYSLISQLQSYIEFELKNKEIEEKTETTRHSYSLFEDIIILIRKIHKNKEFKLERTSNSINDRFKTFLKNLDENDLKKIIDYIKSNGLKGFLHFENQFKNKIFSYVSKHDPNKYISKLKLDNKEKNAQNSKNSLLETLEGTYFNNLEALSNKFD